MIDRFVEWLFRDVKAAEERGRLAGMRRACSIIRDTQWSFPDEGRALVTILNEALEAVATEIEKESGR